MLQKRGVAMFRSTSSCEYYAPYKLCNDHIKLLKLKQVLIVQLV